MTPKNDSQESYLKRQISILSSLGLFYIMILAIFAIPLFGTIVVLLIGGTLEYKDEIIAGGFVLFLITLLWGYRSFKQFTGKVRSGGNLVGNEIKEKMSLGEPVSVSVLHGLLTFTYGGETHPPLKALPFEERPPRQLTSLTAEAKNTEMKDTINQLKELSRLRDQNIIDDEELLLLKAKLIRKDV